MAEDVREILLEALEAGLEAQLRAVRQLRRPRRSVEPRPAKGLSHVDMAHDILSSTGHPLHVAVLLEQIQARFGRQLDRESLVSALVKRVARGDRFSRTAPNTFGLRERE